MPSSHYHQLNEIVELIALTDPQSLLDIGTGFGKYGVLAREYLDVGDGREVYTSWKRTVDGIEAFEGYLTPLQRFVYDRVYVGNALDVLPTLDTAYDLVLLIDVLEHFTHADGTRLLAECQTRGANLLISTPHDIGHQGAAFGNELETHRFQWRRAHLDVLGERFFVPNAYSLICYAGKDARRIKHAFARARRRRAIRRHAPVVAALLRAAFARLGRRGAR